MGIYQHLYHNWTVLEKNAVEIDGESISYAELHRKVLCFGAWLSHRGIEPGDVVVVQLPKSIPLLQILLGSMAYGATILPLNDRYTAAEASFYVDDAQAKMVISLGIHSDERYVSLDDMQRELADIEPLTSLPAVADSSCAILLYTSGTTGKPKGAMISHTNIKAVVEGLATAWHFSAEDRLLHVLPLFHVHGLFVAQFVALYVNSTSVWMIKFEENACLAALRNCEISVFMAVPTLYYRLLSLSGRYVFPHLRLCTSGSAPLPVSIHSAFEDRFGQRILERYGMTEVGIVLSNPYSGERRAGFVGFPVSEASFRIVNPHTMTDVSPGEVGELWISGPSVIQAYLRRPEQTAQTIVGKWLRSGDLASRSEDGYYKIAGRAKDLVISGGMNIYPLEIEAVFLEIPEVAQAAGVGIPCEEWGERFVMVLILNRPIDKEQLFQIAKAQLSSYKRPKEYVFVDDFPRNAMGKVQKEKIRRSLLKR
ncbi:MAG: AMP-binding protein [Myxococcota bacterium]|nr:AMP-binding protein [Myxococcota bacterium]